jgi:hypothetical protein
MWFFVHVYHKQIVLIVFDLTFFRWALWMSLTWKFLHLLLTYMCRVIFILKNYPTWSPAVQNQISTSYSMSAWKRVIYELCEKKLEHIFVYELSYDECFETGSFFFFLERERRAASRLLLSFEMKLVWFVFIYVRSRGLLRFCN